MAYRTAILTSSESISTYAKTNNLIGQLWDIIKLDPNIILISDNNPAPSVAREIIYSHASAKHNMQIYAYGKNGIMGYSVMDLAGTKKIVTNTITLTGAVLKFIYGANMHCLTVKETIIFCIANNQDSAGWIIGTKGQLQAGTIAPPPGFWYPSDADVYLSSLGAPVYPSLNGDGSVPLIPAMLGTGTTQQTCISLWGVSATVFGLTNNIIYKDSNGVNYLLWGNKWLCGDN